MRRKNAEEIKIQISSAFFYITIIFSALIYTKSADKSDEKLP